MEMVGMEEAVTLARVSTKEQELEGYSVDAQTEYLVRYCETKRLKVVKQFKIAETASKPERRKEFQEMLNYLRKHKIRHLVVEKVDRLTRNSKSAIAIDDWLDADGARRLHLPKNSLILHKESTSQDRFMWDIYVAVAKQYANNLREEVKKGVVEKLRQGWYPATRPPIGYKHRGEKGQKTQVIDEEKAPIVRLAFKLYDGGNYSIEALALELKNLGLTNLVGKPLSKSYVHMMLRNKFYVGIMTWCGAEYPGEFEPLIDTGLFERVQARLGHGTTPQVHKSKEITLMHKKAHCKVCGAMVSWYRQKGRWYGECKSKRHKSLGCKRQDEAANELASYFEQLVAPAPEVITWVKQELRNANNSATEQYTAAVAQITKHVQALDGQLAILYEDRLSGRISPEIYDQKYREKTQERAIAAKNKESLSKRSIADVERSIALLNLTQDAVEIFKEKPVDAQRVLLDDMFEGITLCGKQMAVEWRWETGVVREAAQKTKRLKKILEPSSDPCKIVLSEACRSQWLAVVYALRTPIMRNSHSSD